MHDFVSMCLLKIYKLHAFSMIQLREVTVEFYTILITMTLLTRTDRKDLVVHVRYDCGFCWNSLRFATKFFHCDFSADYRYLHCDSHSMAIDMEK